MIFETNDRRICTFNNLKRTISASYSEHKRYRKKSELEFEGPENQNVSFEMKFIAGHGVRPWSMVNKPSGTLLEKTDFLFKSEDLIPNYYCKNERRYLIVLTAPLWAVSSSIGPYLFMSRIPEVSQVKMD